MRRRAAVTTRYATGIGLIDAKLQQFEVKVANKVAYAAVTAGLRYAASAIRKDIPVAHKAVRKAIGTRAKKLGNDGYTGKAGSAVGKARKAEARPRKKKEPGVGISGRNVHWYLMGTAARVNRKSGQYTGKMPRQANVSESVKQSSVKAKIMQAGTKGIQKEINKLAVR